MTNPKKNSGSASGGRFTLTGIAGGARGSKAGRTEWTAPTSRRLPNRRPKQGK